MILIGSRALALRAPQIIARRPLDFDFVCTKEEFTSWMDKNSHKVNPTKVYELPEFNKWIVEGSTNLEFEIIKPGTSAELLVNLVENDPDTIDTPFGLVPTLNTLLAIKDSHKYKKFETSRGCATWYKNAIDWHMMTMAGAQIQSEHKEFIALREKETYTHKLPVLNVSSKDFFDSNMNGVEQTFIHDDIHKAIALNDKPAYEYYLKEGSEVMTSKKKFYECSEHIRLSGIIEEAMTLALERSLISHPGVWSPDYAFRFALAKVASTICGGYFRSYCFLNLFEAIKSYPKDFFEKFQKAVENGRVRYIAK